MSFRQSLTRFIQNQWTMIKPRRLKIKGAIEQRLPICRKQQVFTAHNLSDLHGGVIDHDSELIGRHVIPPPDEKIAKILARDCDPQTESFILKFQPLSI